MTSPRIVVLSATLKWGWRRATGVLQEPHTPTRSSCVSCVEKHLGAAYVLLTEAREGYAYRLRAVSHLFEAEDESQEWAVPQRDVDRSGPCRPHHPRSRFQLRRRRA
ncbi:MAG: hypothetical protein ACUVQR_14955, partial [Thermogutta sp.]